MKQNRAIVKIGLLVLIVALAVALSLGTFAEGLETELDAELETESSEAGVVVFAGEVDETVPEELELELDVELTEEDWEGSGYADIVWEDESCVVMTSPLSDYNILDGVLIEYNGPGGDVIIPNSVTSIGESAFELCASLTSVTIPDSVTSIGEWAFSGCDSLTSVTIPNSVTSIGDYAFGWCESLTSVTIPNSVTSIGKCAFRSCESLTSVTIPDSVTSIGDHAFAICNSLTSVTIPNSVTSIGDYAFEWCRSLTSVTIPNSVTSIGDDTFVGCESLTSVTIPNSVTSIGKSAFQCCESLTSVTIPNSVTSIGKSAFLCCYSLTSVTIQSTDIELEGNPFEYVREPLFHIIQGSKAIEWANEYGFKYDIIGNADDPTPGEITFPIVIENNKGTKGAFYESLDQYILNTESEKYNAKLAYMLMSLAAAAYNNTGVQDGELTVENAGYRSSSKELYYITKAYEDLGFIDYKPYHYYNNPDDSAYGRDNVAFTIGIKQLSENEAMVLIVIRGSYGEMESFTSDWLSNAKVEINDKGRHLGFSRAADKVYSALKSFLKNRGYNDAAFKSNIRYVITGHSRGAAVSNLLAVKLHDASVPNSKVYSYNFACPDTVKHSKLTNTSKNYKNIFNISNSADAVGVIPGIIGDAVDGVNSLIKEKFKSLFEKWDKYGTTRFYCKDWGDKKEFDLARTFKISDSPHDYKYYVTDMGIGSYKQYSRSKIAARRVVVLTKDSLKKSLKKIVKQFYSDYAFADISEAKLTVKNQVYTGKAMEPTVTVKLGNKKLKKDKNYTISYKNNKDIGTATVTVTGVGNYSGTVKATFKINPKTVTGLRLQTGVRQVTVTWKKSEGIDGYEIQYGLKNDFSDGEKVAINNAKTVKKVLKKLTGGEKYHVRIRSYKKVGKTTYYSAWTKAKTVKTKKK